MCAVLTSKTKYIINWLTMKKIIRRTYPSMQSFTEAQSPEEEITKKKRLKKYLLSGLAAGAVIGGSAYALRKRKSKQTDTIPKNNQKSNAKNRTKKNERITVTLEEAMNPDYKKLGLI